MRQLRRIAAALGPRARLLGRVPRERMHALHQTADLFALGTLGEPFSIAIAEALATGVPVVHHRDPVTDWVAEAGGVAVSMADGDSELLVAELRRLESDAAERGRLGAAGRALAESRYAPAVVCAALEREWRRIARLGNRS